MIVSSKIALLIGDHLAFIQRNLCRCTMYGTYIFIIFLNAAYSRIKRSNHFDIEYFANSKKRIHIQKLASIFLVNEKKLSQRKKKTGSRSLPNTPFFLIRILFIRIARLIICNFSVKN